MSRLEMPPYCGVPPTKCIPPEISALITQEAFYPHIEYADHLISQVSRPSEAVEGELTLIRFLMRSSTLLTIPLILNTSQTTTALTCLRIYWRFYGNKRLSLKLSISSRRSWR